MPVTFAYSPAITIAGTEGSHAANAVALPNREANAFIKNVRAAFKRLDKLGTGHALITAINSSGHHVTIFRSATDPKKPNEWLGACSQGNPEGIATEIACSIVSFRPRSKNLPIVGNLMQKKGERPANNRDQGAYKPFYDTYKADLAALGGSALQSKAQAAGELDVVLTRAGNGDLARGRRMAEMLTNVSVANLAAMAQGTQSISDNVYYKICFFFYDFLTPGPGVNTCVRLPPEVRMAGLQGGYKPKTDSTAVPPEILLGHELIHSWRMLVGRRVVRQGWEEEAMTTGLGMFRPWKFTENRLRSEAGLPLRSTYNDGTLSSYFGNNLKQATENLGGLPGDIDSY